MENTIDIWAESIASLPDKEFFNIMRLYLGKIKTPYNKQRLASQLASFLKTPENINNILSFLDDFDCEILCAVRFINNLTQENLVQFFSDSYKLPLIYSRLANLQERLLIYTIKNQDDKIIFLINPILLPYLEKFLSIEKLLPEPVITQKNFDDVFILSQNFLVAFVSALKNYNFSLKADGFLKKNSLNAVESIFPGRGECIQLLVNAFLNLSLLREGKKSLEIDDERLSMFASLSEGFQYALLCAASCSRFSRDGLKKEAQLLLDCLASVPETGFTRKSLLRLSYMLGTKTEDGSAVAKNSRFSQILAAARSKDNYDAFQNVSVLDRMIDSAVQFGLIQKTGTDENGEAVYISGKIESVAGGTGGGSDTRTGIKPLNIESTFAVSLMPGLQLSQSLVFSEFLKIRQFGVVCQFELTKDSASCAFDKGMSAQTIFEILEKFSVYEVPQNLRINVLEWYNSFSSIVMYKGFVLKVIADNIPFVENNPKIQKYVQEKLADGVYLLNLPLDSEPEVFLAECGLTSVGSVKTPVLKHEILAFPLLRTGRRFDFKKGAGALSGAGDADYGAGKLTSTETASTASALIENFIDRLSTLELDKNQKEGLKNRIMNRLIITESQLSSEAVRTEILEAEGMDFSGKLHLIDAAQKDGDLLEIQIPNPDGTKGYQTIVGKPETLVRSPTDGFLCLLTEPEKQYVQLYVSRMTHVRRLHF